MARRKRASLKNKDPESLGLTPTKGKGIDMLFGGPVEEDEAAAEAEPEETEETAQPNSGGVSAPTSLQDENDLSGLVEQPATPVAAAPPAVPVVTETLPVNEADDDETGVVSSSEEFDELGLPVAMEAPPSDLEFATMSTENSVDPSRQDASDPSLSPFAAPPSSVPASPPPPPPPVPTSSSPAAEVVEDDLSGLLEEDDLSGLLGDDPFSGLGAQAPAAPPPQTAAPPPPPPTAATPGFEAAAADDDLSALAATDELAGLATDPYASDFPADQGLSTSETGFDSTSTATPFSPTGFSPASPPEEAAPVDTTFDSFDSFDSTAIGASPLESEQGFSSTPASGGSPAPDRTAAQLPYNLPDQEVESFGGIAAQPGRAAEEDILPADVGRPVEAGSGIIDTREVDSEQEDAALAEEVIRYIGRERRENLDKEIERLYTEVAAELSVNTKDAADALEKLSKAQDIVFEEAHEYDEALYLVAVVKTMLARKRNLRRWSYTWGMFVFFYATIWLIAFITGFLFVDLESVIAATSPGSISISTVLAAWFSALAGGIGGIIGVFYSLYWHVAMKQDFDRQYVMYYLVQPIMGFILGAVIHFIITAGFLVVNFAATTDPAQAQQGLQSTTVIAIQIIFGWIAGFRQRVVFEMIDKIVQRVLPRDEDENADPVSLAPPGENQ